MKIQKTNNGWLIEPDTSDEQKALEYLIDALDNTYSQVVTRQTIDENDTVS